MSTLKVIILETEKVSGQLRKILWNRFTFSDGELRIAIKNKTIHKAFIALIDEKFVGWSAVYNLGYEKCPDNIKLVKRIGVFVDPGFRGRGIGKKLLNKSIKFCKENKMPCVWFDAKNNYRMHFIGEKRRKVNGR